MPFNLVPARLIRSSVRIFSSPHYLVVVVVLVFSSCSMSVDRRCLFFLPCDFSEFTLRLSVVRWLCSELWHPFYLNSEFVYENNGDEENELSSFL